MVRTLKKVLCSLLTLGIMVTVFAGSGMEVKAEAEKRDFEYQERWSVIGAERLDYETKKVPDARIGSIITPEIRDYEGYEYVNTEYASAVFDEDEAGYVIKSWNAEPNMNEGNPYLFHYYKPVEGAGYFQYWFSASHAPGQSMNSGHPASFTNSTVNAEDILNDILQKFSYSNCNVVGVYEDEARTKPISGTYTGGTSRKNATDIYIEFDCEHADVPKVGSFCLTDASYDSATKTIKATFTFDYSKMDGQWIFDFVTENCQSKLNWGWDANGSGTASATSEFKVVDENVPLVIVSGGFYLPENRDDCYPISMSRITIDPKDPTANLTPTPNPTNKDWQFGDVVAEPGNWKYEAVKFITENGIMNGTAPNEFKPDDSLTRAMFATMLYRMAGEPAVTFTNKFPDVPANKWYSNAVIWASEQGIVSGYGSGNFGTGHSITREQIAKMLMEYGKKQGYDVNQSASFSSFADAGKVSSWANDYMKWAVGSGMIGGSQKNGKYYLNPQGNATRAESATMLMRFMEKY